MMRFEQLQDAALLGVSVVADRQAVERNAEQIGGLFQICMVADYERNVALQFPLFLAQQQVVKTVRSSRREDGGARAKVGVVYRSISC